MSHVVTALEPPFLAAGGRLRIRAIPAATDNLVWLAECTATGAAAVVDGPDAAPLLAVCDAEGIALSTVLNTHTHGDHVGVNRDLLARGRLPATVVGPAAVAAEVPGITTPVDDGDVVHIGVVTGRVVRTEGHKHGHVCFVFGDDDGVVFSGDTLFTGGCGYLFDGPADAMFASLMRLAALPEGTRVCCAHEYTEDNLRFAWSVEPDNLALAERIRATWARRREGRACVPSTIGLERATNPFLRPGSPTLRASVAAALPGADVSTLPAVFAATRRLKDEKRHRAIPDAALPLDAAPLGAP